MSRPPSTAVVLLALAAHGVLTAKDSDIKFVARWGGVTKDIAFAVVAAPASPHVFVVGSAFSDDFPVTAGRSIPTQHWCAFATALSNENGAGIFSTVLCSAGDVWGNAAALGRDGELWVGGNVNGRGLPTSPGAFQRSYGGSTTATGTGDGFVARWDAGGRAAIYASYFGASGDDSVTAMVADHESGVWVVGTTSSGNFPTTPAAVTQKLRGATDGFVAHISGEGKLLASALLGGPGWDAPVAVARIDDRRLLIAGSTTSRQLDNSDQRLEAADGFAIMFDTRSFAPEWYRRFGGRGVDRINAVVVLGNRDVVLVGDTADACTAVGGQRDAWLVTISSGGRMLRQSCFGGEALDEARGAVLIGQSLWVTGRTQSVSRRWTGTTALAGGYDRAFIAKLAVETQTRESSFLISPHIGRGNALAQGQGGTLLAVGEIGNAGRRFLVPENTDIRPSPGAFSLGAEKGSTDPYLIGFAVPDR